MLIVKYIAVAVISYLLGSVSFSILMSKLFFGGDVRKKGSGNAGATNMARVYGLKAGLFTLLGDFIKAIISIVIGWLLLGEAGIAVGGIACLIGHCFPVLHSFHGGKGVSVGAAVALAVGWQVFLVVAGSFLLAALLSRKVSLGSICGAISITVAALIFDVSTPRLILSVIGMVIVVFQHRENISRLIKGTEPDFKAAKTR